MPKINPAAIAADVSIAVTGAAFIYAAYGLCKLSNDVFKLGVETLDAWLEDDKTA